MGSEVEMGSSQSQPVLSPKSDTAERCAVCGQPWAPAHFLNGACSAFLVAESDTDTPRFGGAFSLGALAEVATKAVYTHGFGFREVVGPHERDGKVYVNFAWDDDRLVRAVFFVSPGEYPDDADDGASSRHEGGLRDEPSSSEEPTP